MLVRCLNFQLFLLLLLHLLDPGRNLQLGVAFEFFLREERSIVLKRNVQEQEDSLELVGDRLLQHMLCRIALDVFSRDICLLFDEVLHD